MKETTKLNELRNCFYDNDVQEKRANDMQDYKSKRICSCNLCTPTPECIQAQGNYEKLVEQNKELQQEINKQNKMIELMVKDLKKDAGFYEWLASGKAISDIRKIFKINEVA